MDIKINEDLQDLLANIVKDRYKQSLDTSICSIDKFGDLSTNIALRYAKFLGKNSVDLGDELVEELKTAIKKNELLNDYVSDVVNANGFINFSLSNLFWIHFIANTLPNIDKFGTFNEGKGKTWLIEHTSPNPNKAMHIGHLRNNTVSMSIIKLTENLGFNVIKDCIDNNRGIAIAKLMWGYLKYGRKNESAAIDINYWYSHQNEWYTPESKNIRPDRFVDEMYVKGASDYKDDEVCAKKIRQMVIDWENEDVVTWKLWERVLSYTYMGQKMTLKRLDSLWDNVWHEHEIYKQGKELVLKGLKNNVFRKSEGAIVTNLKKYNLPDTVVLKSDGTSLYITQDIALTKLKKEKFKAERMFWVVGPEQSLQLKQLFAVCEQLGIGKIGEFTHLTFGYMSIKGQGKMSSRLGNVVYIDDILDKSKEIVLQRINNPDIDPDEKNEIAEKVGVGSVKYGILKVGRLLDIAFDYDTALSVEGNSCPYIMYTYVRTVSLLKDIDISAYEFGNIDISNVESDIIKHLYRYPTVVHDAACAFAPNLVCDYLYVLCQKFNKFYNDFPILKEPDEKKRNLRIAITLFTSKIIKKSLNLLNISTVDKM